MIGSKQFSRAWRRLFLLFVFTLVGTLFATACVTPIRVPMTPTPNVVPTFTPTPEVTAQNVGEDGASAATATPAAETEPSALSATPLTVSISPLLNERETAWLLPLLMGISELDTESGPRPVTFLDRAGNANLIVAFVPHNVAPENVILEHFFAAVVPFATVNDETSMAQLGARWRGEEEGGLIVPLEHLAELTAIFGVAPAAGVNITSGDLIFDALAAAPQQLAIVAFEQLHPRFKVLTVDGVNVLSNQFDAAAYPLAAALVVTGDGATSLTARLAEAAPERTNRRAEDLTTLLMTGVTAMSRVTALRMEQRGYTYPALVISDTLAAADITHISNEVPFLDDCVANPTENNLILCSHTNYWATLEAVGTDIVGLSGNHVNDFGREGARRSITWYQENNIPIYGGGMNIDEACAPLFWEHNGNTFAFIAVLAFEPQFAWATEDQPGACHYYTHKQRIFDTIAEVRPQVDILAVELQYLETYNPYPTPQQVIEFRELRELGVDIVTGVQSHVPQSMEAYAPTADRNASIIVYGLGNLFFDQMWSWQTRTGLMAQHTIYQGKLLSTEILTTVLEDFAQPRWATPTERADLLRSIFNAAPSR